MLGIAGAIAIALAVTAIALMPLTPLALPQPRTEHPDAAVLADAGWRRSLWVWELVRAGCALAFAALAVAAGIGPALGLGLGASLPSFAARVQADRARRDARRATTRLLRATEGALHSTGTLVEALRRATVGVDDPLARRPFADALRAFDLGAPLDAALRDAAARSGDRRARTALETLALGVGERLPSDRAARLVGAVADRLSFDERLDEEVRARTGGLRLQVLLLAAIVPCLALYLAMTVPALGATLASPLGRGLLVPAAALLEVAGIAFSRRVVAGALR